MIVHFAVANTGKRPVESGYTPFFYVETDEVRFMLHPNLLIFVEMGLKEPFAKCLHETMTPEVFLRDKLPFMTAAAARDKRDIDEHQLQRFLAYVRKGETPAAAPRVRERTRPAALAPDQGVSRVRERVRAATGVELPPLPEPTPPTPRERIRQAAAQSDAVVAATRIRERTRPTAPPVAYIRERTRG